jgi:hypothetical protein
MWGEVGETIIWYLFFPFYWGITVLDYDVHRVPPPPPQHPPPSSFSKLKHTHDRTANLETFLVDTSSHWSVIFSMNKMQIEFK